MLCFGFFTLYFYYEFYIGFFFFEFVVIFLYIVGEEEGLIRVDVVFFEFFLLLSVFVG